MISQNIITDVSRKEEIPWLVVEKDYFLTLLLEGISNSKLKEFLVFKGGTALRKVYFKNYRYSEDLDFTLKEILTKKRLEVLLQEVFDYLKKEYNAEFIITSLYTKNWFTDAKIQFIGLRQVKNTITLDLMSDEVIVDEVKEKTIFNPYYERKISVPIYSLEEILAEKLRSLLQRTRVRDYYDVWYILKHEKSKLDFKKVKEFFTKKLEYKKIRFNDVTEFLDENKVEQARNYFEKQLKHQIEELPEFNVMIKDLEKNLKEINLK